jgi:valyl-tRNA synthetase
MHDDFLKPYDQSKEKEIYAAWEQSGYFNPDNLPTSGIKNLKFKIDNFSIVMPPPNANGSLHVGHALGMTVEDLLIRYWRMRGRKTLWLPGADHAGFETQVVFEKKLEKEGTSRFEILQKPNGREELYQKIWDFTQANKAHMENQIRELGASCDWSRKTFTLDPKIVGIVYDTFKQLYDDGLIYRDKRIVNWCVKHQTSLSDLEVNWEERSDSLYYVTYASTRGGEAITVATTRPETIPGDVAIAVHPKDKRYTKLVGEEMVEPITKKRIPVIADEAVEMTFGTGALKITPAHDPADFEIGKRHKLPTIQTFDKNGRFNELAGPFAGMKVHEAREAAAELLKKEGVLEKTEPYAHQVAVCYKCRNIIEPLILPQWFVDLTGKGKKKLVQPAIDAVKKGKVQIVPDFQKKIFLHWMENIRDWNISRQIVWGIPIPAWYRENSKIKIQKSKFTEADQQEIYIGDKKPAGEGWIKETDVFDTWFSSGQWPFATLRVHGIEKEFYPTAVMDTAYDILFFWVARMIMFGLYRTGKVPFETVYLHGLVRDKDRQKMSKSKGNVVDPLGIVEQYGADALRMGLIVGNSPGQDAPISEDKIKGYRNFSNKIWNIARFVMQNMEESGDVSSVALAKEDEKFLKQCQAVKKKVAGDIEKFRFSQAAETAYHYVWHELADKILESKKELVKTDTSSQAVLYLLLVESLKMLHPFMPFVTEAIYQKLPAKNAEFLMVEEW